MGSEFPPDREVTETKKFFLDAWPSVTAPDRMTLFGFRRFRTSHLLNLRYLEHEIAQLDQVVFHAGLGLNKTIPSGDKLALESAKERYLESSVETPPLDDGSLLRLRELLKQYDEALILFNQVMTMETFSLADHQGLAARMSASPEETFRTRLIQVDRPMRNGVRDPLQHLLRKVLRRAWFHLMTRRQAKSILPATRPSSNPGDNSSHQNTAWIAETLSRFVFSIAAGLLLITPMVVLSRQANSVDQLTTVSICIVLFAFLISLASRASHQETMAASAAYAAVLVVFVSNTNNSPEGQA